MIDEKNTAVITYIDNNFEENLEKDFLYTLREVALYKGQIILLDYGMSTKKKDMISEKYNVKIHTFEKNMPVFTLRNRDIPTVIDGLQEEITNVMVIDGGDVWFQKPITQIFDITKDKMGFVTEPIDLKVQEWVAECLNNMLDINPNIDFNIKEDNLKNSGMICGPKKDILEITRAVYTDIIDVGKEFFGIDQLFFNYEINKICKGKIICLDDEFNYVIIAHKDEFTIKNGKVFDKDLNLVTVVHNNGGIFRVINRPHTKKISDESIYISKNIRTINV